jgi:virginiamycin B lyase
MSRLVWRFLFPSVFILLPGIASGASRNVTPAHAVDHLFAAELRQYAVAHNGYVAWTAAGPPGSAWLLAYASVSGKPWGYEVVRVAPDGSQRAFPFPHRPRKQPLSNPYEITLGPDGNLWYTIFEHVGRMTPTGHQTLFPAGDMHGISVGADGNLWAADRLGEAIDRVTPTGQMTTFSLKSGSQPVEPVGLALGADRCVYFTDIWSGGIGKITVKGAVSTFALPPYTHAVQLALGPDGKIWAMDWVGMNTLQPHILSLAPDGRTRVFALPANTILAGTIVSGPRARMWFGDSAYGLRWIDMTGKVGGIRIPALGNPNTAGILSVGRGAGDALWVTTFQPSGYVLYRVTVP